MYEFNIHCISFLKEAFFKKMEFLGETRDIKNGDILTFKKENDFFNGKQRKIVSLKLVSNKKSLTFFFEYFKSNNHAYCFLDNPGITFCLLFNKMDNIQIKVEPLNSTTPYDIVIYDTNNTKYRRRYTMINLPFDLIKFNNNQIDLMEYIKNFERNKNSFQLSFYNYKNIVTQPIELFENDKDNIQIIVENNKDMFKIFNNKLKKMLEAEDKSERRAINKEIIKECINIRIPKYFLNKSKNKLKEFLSKPDSIDFFYNSTIFYLYNSFYRRKRHIKWETIKKIFSYVINLCDNIKKDDSLKFIYQKVLLIEQIKKLMFQELKLTQLVSQKA